jgi:hypothetical protein
MISSHNNSDSSRSRIVKRCKKNGQFKLILNHSFKKGISTRIEVFVGVSEMFYAATTWPSVEAGTKYRTSRI